VTSSEHPSNPRTLTRNPVRARPRSGMELRRRSPPITCASCHVIYLTYAALPVSVKPQHWICGACLTALLKPDEPFRTAAPPSGRSTPAKPAGGPFAALP
jgi:hypothetical protein